MGWPVHVSPGWRTIRRARNRRRPGASRITELARRAWHKSNYITVADVQQLDAYHPTLLIVVQHDARSDFLTPGIASAVGCKAHRDCIHLPIVCRSRLGHRDRAPRSKNAGITRTRSRACRDSRITSHVAQCAAAQLLPVPVSTTSGTDSTAALSITPRATSTRRAASSSGASNSSSSCTWSSMRERRPAARRADGKWIIARLMMSAAPPCNGALIACRSA